MIAVDHMPMEWGGWGDALNCLEVSWDRICEIPWQKERTAI